jgi:hypothetical protein
MWKWVGDPQEVTAEKLERAEQLFFFALCRHQIVSTALGEELHFDLLKGKGGVRNYSPSFTELRKYSSLSNQRLMISKCPGDDKSNASQIDRRISTTRTGTF